jgi:hypothetical protein
VKWVESKMSRIRSRFISLAALVTVASAATALCQAPASVAAPAPEGPRMEIYGFAQLDFGYDFKQTDPN